MNIIAFKMTRFSIGTVALVLISQLVSGNEFTRVNRYTIHTLAAESSQVDLLSAVIDTRFPANVETVGKAIDYVLHRSGYRHIATEDVLHTLELPLPESHRTIGPLDIRTAVQTIIGQPWQLHEDSAQRILWFQRVGADLNNRVQPPETLRESMRPSTPNTGEFESSNSKVWQLQASLTLRENLQNWVQQANWSLEWRSQHDYAITHSAIFSGTLLEAIGNVLKHYQDAPVPLVARYYAGNAVLVVQPDYASVRSQ